MSKSLKTIQMISRICKILCTILFICSIVATSLCFLSMLLITLLGPETVIPTEVLQTLGFGNYESVYVFLMAGLLATASEIILSKHAETYFKNELKAGTPFTEESTKEMFRLGVVAIAVSLGTSIIIAILYAVVGSFYADITEFSISGAGSVVLGLLFMIFSAIFRYGTELKAQAERNNTVFENSGINSNDENNGEIHRNNENENHNGNGSF